MTISVVASHNRENSPRGVETGKTSPNNDDPVSLLGIRHLVSSYVVNTRYLSAPARSPLTQQTMQQ